MHAKTTIQTLRWWNFWAIREGVESLLINTTFLLWIIWMWRETRIIEMINFWKKEYHTLTKNMIRLIKKWIKLKGCDIIWIIKIKEELWLKNKKFLKKQLENVSNLFWRYFTKRGKEKLSITSCHQMQSFPRDQQYHHRIFDRNIIPC